MLILYDKNHNKGSPLKLAKEPKVERELSGMETLSFYYPETKSLNIKEECYIRTKNQEYVIKETNNLTPQWLYVNAQINLEDIRGKPIENYEVVNSTITDAINLALTGTGWTLEFTNISRRRTVRRSNCNGYDVLENIRKTFRAELVYDAVNRKIYAYDKLGQDKGAYFSDELNLKKLTVQGNSYDFYTRIIPIGKDGLKINEVNNGVDYVENNQYSSKIITLIWEDNRYTDPQILKEDAIAKLEELSKPICSYIADIYDRAKMSDKYKDILDFNLGDTITIINKDTQTKEKQRVVKTIEFLDEPERNSCEIANRTLKFEDLQVGIMEAADTLSQITTEDGMVYDYKINFDPIRQEFGQIVAEKASITELIAAVARIGTLEVTSATITQLDTEIARINDLYTIKANVGELTAAVGRISILESDVASIDTILAKNVFAELAQFGQILAGSSIIAEGAIGSAQISDLSASKLTAGIINAAQVTIQGTDGRLRIVNNRLQVFSGTTQLFERVALGDVHGDGSEYGLLVRGADGQTTLFDNNGLTDKGFTDGYNKLDDNSLNPVKLDIAQVVTRINEGTTTIESSKIYMDNKTLDVAIGTIETTINSHGQSINSQGAQITALNNAIQLKVDTQTYTSDLDNINSQLSTQSSAISLLQGEVAIKVTQTDINNAVNPLDSRITSAEGTLVTHATQIAARVTTTVYNSGIADAKDYADERANAAQNAAISHTDTQFNILNGAIQLKVDENIYTSKMQQVDGTLQSVDAAISSHSSQLNLLSNEIALKVSETDIDGNYLIGKINLTGTTAKIQASKINLVGAVTVLSDITGNLGTITAGTINGITINSVNLNSATINGGNIVLSGDTSGVQALVINSNTHPDRASRFSGGSIQMMNGSQVTVWLTNLLGGLLSIVDSNNNDNKVELFASLGGGRVNCGSLMVRGGAEVNGTLIAGSLSATNLSVGGKNVWNFMRGESVNGVDMNTVLSTGFYHGFSQTNSAFNSISTFIVINYSNDWIVQIQFAPKAAIEAWIRARHSGTTWTAWKRFIA
ncbi:phage tail protein [Alkalicella caledoniensis]|uniref:Phage tail protein n=1 Tax=Alkalicella caledoniensis TaxID=2731377 RepID=A0A7G9W8A5_ALKCA|nr:phage tail spike protein [Alkalicella caledoniensis]QNO14917.1 phage tail protein [Alkalicella caledoniensis]